MIRQLIACSFLLLLPSFAAAHPGHGVDGGSTAMHYVTDPFHLAAWVLLIVAIVLATAWQRATKSA